jgi:hypothetical protein
MIDNYIETYFSNKMSIILKTNNKFKVFDIKIGLNLMAINENNIYEIIKQTLNLKTNTKKGKQN